MRCRSTSETGKERGRRGEASQRCPRFLHSLGRLTEAGILDHDRRKEVEVEELVRGRLRELERATAAVAGTAVLLTVSRVVGASLVYERAS